MDQILSESFANKEMPARPNRYGVRLLHLMGLFTISLLSGCQATSPDWWDMNRFLPGRTPDHGIKTGNGYEDIRFQSPELASAIQDPQDSQQMRSERDVKNLVSDVIVRGNEHIPTHRILRNVSTRPGRYFDPDQLQQDVQKLWQMPEIDSIKGPYIKHTPEGIVVTIDVVERNRLNTVKFVGNRGITDRKLRSETGLEDGQPLDVHQIRMAKTRIEDVYKEKGYPRTQVEILEGDDQQDGNVVFLIHEDQQQRVWKVDFDGNSIASDARLKHFIETKPGILKIIGGLAKRNEIQQDILRLTNYYRSLGFFNARIGREISESNDGRWLTVRFIIDEGPRYRVRNVSMIGNQAYSSEELTKLIDLKPTNGVSPDFNVAKMNQDANSLRDLYGSQGYVFSSIEAEPRFLETPGELDIVFKINEGKQYRVGNVNVHIEGDVGITKRQVALNRMSLRPGDLIDIREIRNSERRLGSARIFAGGDPNSPGSPPKVVVRPPELRELERMASQGGTKRSY